MLQNLVVHHQEVKTINQKEQLALVMTHVTVLENDEPVELYAVKKHFKVLTEGPSDLFFDAHFEAILSCLGQRNLHWQRNDCIFIALSCS